VSKYGIYGLNTSNKFVIKNDNVKEELVSVMKRKTEGFYMNTIKKAPWK